MKHASITAKYLCPTNYRGSRIKFTLFWVDRKASKTINFEPEWNNTLEGFEVFLTSLVGEGNYSMAELDNKTYVALVPRTQVVREYFEGNGDR